MDRLKLDEKICNAESSLEKANFIAMGMLDRYDLDLGVPETMQDLAMFGSRRKDICIEIEIITDYINKTIKAVSEVREATEV